MTHATIKSRLVLSVCVTGALVFAVPLAPSVAGQTNYTVGDNDSADHKAFLFCPFKFEFDPREDEYRAHVSYDFDTSGQRYDYTQYVQESTPGLIPGECTVTQFRDIIGNKTKELGVLLLSSHGDYNIIAIEVYDSTNAGRNAMLQALNTYINEGPYTSNELTWRITSTGFNAITITDDFVRNYGNLSQGLVYISACEGSSFIDDFLSANARVAVGDTIDAGFWFKADRIRIFFRRMDGKEGREKRPVSAAHAEPPGWMWNVKSGGQENTVLAPAVKEVLGDTPLEVGDVICIHLDTYCDTYWQPQIECDQCSVEFVNWIDSSHFHVELTWPPPSGINECEFTLKLHDIESARNSSYLDGNTDPPEGSNAEGPAHDDYVWTMAVAPCDCGDPWSDVNADGQVNPQDVTIMQQYVYFQNDMRVQPPNCPLEAGDVNCDGDINPVDVLIYQQYVYFQNDMRCPDPCD